MVAAALAGASLLPYQASRLADSEHAIAPPMAPPPRRVRAAYIFSAATALAGKADSRLLADIGCHHATLAKNYSTVDKLPSLVHKRSMARTTKKATIRRPGSVGTLKKKPKPKRVAPPDPHVTLAKCYFCPREVDADEFKCEGCGEVVCEECDELNPWGAHDPFEHTAEGSERDDDGSGDDDV